MPPRALARPRPLAAAALLVAAATLLSACNGQAFADAPVASKAPQTALPTAVPAGTKLTIGDPVTQFALKVAGDQIDAPLDFTVKWANISGGPQSLEAFRAHALDMAAVAEIPSIHATWTGVPARNIASEYSVNWQEAPTYDLAAAPGVKLKSLADLKGKRIAFSPGQAQGALVLKALAKAGLTKDDVTLVELPSTGDVYATTLASKQVDVAPVGGTVLEHYLSQYGKDGATSLKHGLRDDAEHLYGPDEVLDDPAKAAALAQYVAAWAKAKVWIADHPDIWKQKYYIEDQGLSAADAQYLIDHATVPDIPKDLTDGIKRTQQTINLLAAQLGHKPLKAEDLFDQRYVPIAYAAAQEQRKADRSAK